MNMHETGYQFCLCLESKKLLARLSLKWKLNWLQYNTIYFKTHMNITDLYTKEYDM